MISYSYDISTIHNRHIGLLFCIFVIMKKSVFHKLRRGVHVAPGTSCVRLAPIDASTGATCTHGTFSCFFDGPMKNIKFFQCVNVIWSYLQSLLSVSIIIYPLQCAYELPLCMKFRGATHSHTKKAVTHFSLILSPWDVWIYKMNVSRWCVHILE